MNFNRFLKAILFLLVSISSFAHEMRPALLQINQVSDTDYELIWKIPRRDNMILSINPVFPDWFRVSQPLPGVQAGDGALFTMHATSEKSIHKMPINIDGIANSMVDVIVYVQLLSGEKYSLTIQPSHPTVTIPERDTFGATAWTYGKLGVEHILGGPDHLLFVLALLLIVSGARKIFFTITAFTLAHSLTLSLAALGSLSLPGPPVEATIALSIMFLAWELVKLNRGEVVISSQKPWLVSFTFGLLHGLGFAGRIERYWPAANAGGGCTCFFQYWRGARPIVIHRGNAVDWEAVGEKNHYLKFCKIFSRLCHWIYCGILDGGTGTGLLGIIFAFTFCKHGERCLCLCIVL